MKLKELAIPIYGEYQLRSGVLSDHLTQCSVLYGLSALFRLSMEQLQHDICDEAAILCNWRKRKRELTFELTVLSDQSHET